MISVGSAWDNTGGACCACRCPSWGVGVTPARGAPLFLLNIRSRKERVDPSGRGCESDDRVPAPRNTGTDGHDRHHLHPRADVPHSGTYSPVGGVSSDVERFALVLRAGTCGATSAFGINRCARAPLMPRLRR